MNLDSTRRGPTALSSSVMATDLTAPAPNAGVGGSVGLAILRLGIGAAALQAGLIKAFDFSTTVGFMADAGWRLPGLAAFMVTAAETLGGIGLLLLLTVAGTTTQQPWAAEAAWLSGLTTVVLALGENQLEEAVLTTMLLRQLGVGRVQELGWKSCKIMMNEMRSIYITCVPKFQV